MSEQSRINADFRKIVRELLNWPDNMVRPANQNAPAGALENRYITVLISGVISRGSDTVTRESIAGSTDLLFTSEGQRLATASVQAFGEGAFDTLVDLSALLDSEWGTWQFQQANFGFVASRGPGDLSAVFPGQIWQRRARLEVDFYFVVKAQAQIPTFSSFDVTVVIDEDGSTHFEVNA